MEFVNKWAQGIIVAVVIVTIIEMILPNGNSKKYIKMILGLFIIYNIISPIVTKIYGENIKLDSIINTEKYSISDKKADMNKSRIEDINKNNIHEIYILNLKKDMKAKIEDKGYIVENLNIELKDKEDYSIKKISIQISNIENTDYNKEDYVELNKQINTIKDIDIKININNTIYTDSSDTDLKKNKKQLSLDEINQIKNYINSIYDIDKNCIYIN